jgi:phosphoribosylformimino-5-aminoimidazole carboxamide ribotide isomerase
MRVIPVLDVLRGEVVRGAGGRRENYRPIVSQITTSSEPLNVARALRKVFGFHQFYLADLDGILNRRPNLNLYRDLIADDFQLLIDAGIRNLADAKRIRQLEKEVGIVVGLETCHSPEDLRQIARDGTNVTFSLDLISAQPNRRPDTNGWSDQPIEITRQVLKSNVNSILVLDLADVGMGTGGSTDSLCQWIRSEFPTVQLISGGGVRNRNDLDRLSRIGIDAVLVASALHDGQMSPDDVSPL